MNENTRAPVMRYKPVKIIDNVHDRNLSKIDTNKAYTSPNPT